MLEVDTLFLGRKYDTNKLTAFGFIPIKGGYFFTKRLLDGQFDLRVTVNKDGSVIGNVYDADTDDIYTPLKIESAVGAFVGNVRTAYLTEMTAIYNNCFDTDVFANADSKSVIAHVEQTYGDSLEFLWEKLSKCAVFRRKDNNKWYAIIMTVAGDKIGLSDNREVEIIDLRGDPTFISDAVDGKYIFAGYHMNKKHWFTIKLDGSVPIDRLFHYLAISYQLAK